MEILLVRFATHWRFIRRNGTTALEIEDPECNWSLKRVASLAIEIGYNPRILSEDGTTWASPKVF